jgi:hypothetical protein
MSTSDDTRVDHDILVIIGDDQRARFVRPGAGCPFEIVWEGYAASATPAHLSEGRRQFANDVAEHVGRFVRERPSLRLIVIAPPSFASALRASLGDMWPSLPGEVVRRDETGLEDARLLAFVETMLRAHPERFAVTR